jgi:hypothetical protein
MNKEHSQPILSFGATWSERDDLEAASKGYRGDCKVELPDKRVFSVYFYDPIRLQQDLAYEKMIAEVGLIVIDELTRERMEDAVVKLWQNGYFENFKPLNL